MSPVLADWNNANTKSAMEAMTNCCGANRWAAAMVNERPIDCEATLHETADLIWDTMTEVDWVEAFSHHPRIGERRARHASSQSTAWSGQEQSLVQSAAESILSRLAEGNARYEAQFGFTYIVCATGKSPVEMLAILERRLANALPAELREAAEQQRMIMHIRLRKWLEQ